SSSVIEITAYLASMPTNACTLSSHTSHPCQPMPVHAQNTLCNPIASTYP
ncbi:hypothetical protein A2U01_0085087, partial [Trifolium medium]|nr:hypothetical protein [Trifolium medium]